MARGAGEDATGIQATFGIGADVHVRTSRPGSRRRHHTDPGGYGWGGRIRTSVCESQSLVPYRLATPHQRTGFPLRTVPPEWIGVKTARPENCRGAERRRE